MIDDSKQAHSGVDGNLGVRGKSRANSKSRLQSTLVKSHVLIPVGAGILQVMVGLSLVAISILGVISPLWLSAVLSLAGSVSCMAGVFLIYHVVSSKGSFESLINQSIRRVISAQN